MNAIRTLGCAALASLSLVALAAADPAPTATGAWARATPPGADTAAVYLTVQGGQSADRLVSASTPRAAMVHLHAEDESGGMARMRPLDALEIAPGKRVELAPRGLHLMLMGVKTPLAAGERFPLTLHFEKGGDRVVEVQVRPATAVPYGAPPAGH